MTEEFSGFENEFHKEGPEYFESSEYFKSPELKEESLKEITPLYDEYAQGPVTTKTEVKESKYSRLKKMVYLVAACGSAVGIGYASYATANVGTELTEIVSEVEQTAEEISSNDLGK